MKWDRSLAQNIVFFFHLYTVFKRIDLEQPCRLITYTELSIHLCVYLHSYLRALNIGGYLTVNTSGHFTHTSGLEIP